MFLGERSRTFYVLNRLFVPSGTSFLPVNPSRFDTYTDFDAIVSSVIEKGPSSYLYKVLSQNFVTRSGEMLDPGPPPEVLSSAGFRYPTEYWADIAGLMMVLSGADAPLYRMLSILLVPRNPSAQGGKP
jgi:hypothetical protein